MRARPDDLVGTSLLHDVSHPTRGPRHDEERGEQVGRDAALVVGARGVEVGIGIHPLPLLHQLLHVLADGVQRRLALGPLAQLPAQVLEHGVPGVAVLVDPVAESHDHLLVLQLLVHHLLPLLGVLERLQQVHHRLVRTAVKVSPQRSDGRGDARVGVRHGRGGDPGGEGGGREVVLGVQDVRGVHHLVVEGVGLLALPEQQLQENLGQGVVVLQEGVHVQPDAADVVVVPVQDHGPEGAGEPLRDAEQRLVVLGHLHVVDLLGLQGSQDGATSAQDVHGVSGGGELLQRDLKLVWKVPGLHEPLFQGTELRGGREVSAHQ
mmetsp:Transcript_2629/g.7991  ORF Transcript_2629/g.7991 Transcript_2629/m.7991 type:complete len:321 (-) Transcript_2629:410-1372(-)